jgi:hypothetical protein
LSLLNFAPARERWTGAAAARYRLIDGPSAFNARSHCPIIYAAGNGEILDRHVDAEHIYKHLASAVDLADTFASSSSRQPIGEMAPYAPTPTAPAMNNEPNLIRYVRRWRFMYYPRSKQRGLGKRG